ncbi:MAG TPA: DUF1802 family protein [Tepidisphaeraceae bacterium]|nr:DUF1802 family protein [Tepidisphaeraceae bacterium]
MAWPTSLAIALKEWASVCNALETGRQIILLRKGGIYEAAGEFELENPQFLLFPTYLHQNLNMLKPEAHPGFEAMNAEPGEVRISAAGVVSDIVQLRAREQMDAIEDEHVWASPLIDMRFNYKPQNPLYLMLIRAYRLHEPAIVANTPAYAGCKSWVPLDGPIGTRDATPALDDVRYEARRKRIVELIGGE